MKLGQAHDNSPSQDNKDANVHYNSAIDRLHDGAYLLFLGGITLFGGGFVAAGGIATAHPELVMGGAALVGLGIFTLYMAYSYFRDAVAEALDSASSRAQASPTPDSTLPPLEA